MSVNSKWSHAVATKLTEGLAVVERVKLLAQTLEPLLSHEIHVLVCRLSAK